MEIVIWEEVGLRAEGSGVSWIDGRWVAASGAEEKCPIPGKQQGKSVDNALDLELWSLFGVRDYMWGVN